VTKAPTITALGRYEQAIQFFTEARCHANELTSIAGAELNYGVTLWTQHKCNVLATEKSDPTFRNDAFIAPSRVSALLERQMVLFFARGVVFCKAEVPWHSNDIELCVFVHESAFVENPETYKLGKTACNGLSFFQIISPMSKSVKLVTVSINLHTNRL